MGQCNFLHLWHQKLYRAFRFGTLWPISCSYPRHSQLTRHSLMLANGRIRQSLTALVIKRSYCAEKPCRLPFSSPVCSFDIRHYGCWRGTDTGSPDHCGMGVIACDVTVKCCMMASSNGNIFHVTGLSWGKCTDHRLIPLIKASDAELWCFVWSAPEETADQTIETPVIWDA